MIINVPDWCVIGKFIEFKMWDENYRKYNWFKDKIISYTEDGFYHQTHNCPVYHNKFSDYGKTVRECK